MSPQNSSINWITLKKLFVGGVISYVNGSNYNSKGY